MEELRPAISRAITTSFSVPVPTGFEEYTSPAHRSVYAEGGLILAEAERPSFSDAFQASIVISPLPNKGLDLKDYFLCLSIGDNAAHSLNGTVLGVKKSKRKSGPTCQVVVKPKAEKNKLSRAEVLGSAERAWIVTCNYDPRDSAALASCDQVLDGFEALEPIARAR